MLKILGQKSRYLLLILQLPLEYLYYIPYLYSSTISSKPKLWITLARLVKMWLYASIWPRK